MKLPKVRILAGAAVLAAASTLLASTPSAAVTWEVDHATATTWPSGTDPHKCSSNSAGWGCFRPGGDWFAVADLLTDKHSVVVRWKTFDPDTNALHRQGTIWNSAGTNTIRYQNKNFPEGDRIEWEICTGDWDKLEIVAGSCAGYTGATA